MEKRQVSVEKIIHTKSAAEFAESPARAQASAAKVCVKQGEGVVPTCFIAFYWCSVTLKKKSFKKKPSELHVNRS